MIYHLFIHLLSTISNQSSSQGVDEEPPTTNRAGQPIQYELYSVSLIIVEAPTIADLMKAKPSLKRKKLIKTTTKRSATKISSSATPEVSSAAAAAAQIISYIYGSVSSFIFIQIKNFF